MLNFVCTCCFYIILIIVSGYWCEFRQERAKLKYYNPKYLKDCYVFTGRRSRNEAYLTNVSGITLVPFGNNVSFAVTLQLKSGGDFRIVTKCCEWAKSKWILDFVVTYTNVKQECPYPPGLYQYLNMELPPKNLPIPIADGDYYIKMEMFVTATKERVIEMAALLHFDRNKKTRKNKTGTLISERVLPSH